MEASTVVLVIGGNKFHVSKDVLAEHSDYFRAMFNGSYIEKDQAEITIDVVDAISMKIILQYMDIGLIDLSEYSLSTIGDLAISANFLQITELNKQIEYVLDLQLSVKNWVDTLTIAENASYTKLEQLASAYGLLSFYYMKPYYIPTLKRLHWYLSHPYLDAKNELEIFKFGLQWIFINEMEEDLILLILSCLDITKLKCEHLKEMKLLMSTSNQNSLATTVIECFFEMANDNCDIDLDAIIERKKHMCERFTERVYNEVLNLTKQSRSRLLSYTPCVPMWMVKDTKPEIVPHYMYTFSEEKGFEQWMEVAEKNIWGWNVVAWGPTRLVIVCGEHGRGTGMFVKDVKVYDTMRKEWTKHGVSLPARRHAGVAIIGDLLYLVGGVGGFRVVLDTVVVYDLKQRSYRKVAKLPDAIQNPAVCVHESKLYAAGHKNIYRYDDMGETDRWTTVLGTDLRNSLLVSYKDYIYCCQSYFNHLYRFRPDCDHQSSLELVTFFSYPPATICNLGNRLIVFTRTICGQSDNVAVEEYIGKDFEESPKVLWSQSDSFLKVNDVAGSCSLVMTLPPVRIDVSQYAITYLKRYNEV